MSQVSTAHQHYLYLASRHPSELRVPILDVQLKNRTKQTLLVDLLKHYFMLDLLPGLGNDLANCDSAFRNEFILDI